MGQRYNVNGADLDWTSFLVRFYKFVVFIGFNRNGLELHLIET